MFKTLKDAELAYKNGEITIQDLDSLQEVYFKVVNTPAEDIFVVDNWSYEEDDNYDLIVVHKAVPVSRKDLFRNYTLEDLVDPYCDVINCVGHCLTKEEIQEIFWDMGN